MKDLTEAALKVFETRIVMKIQELTSADICLTVKELREYFPSVHHNKIVALLNHAIALGLVERKYSDELGCYCYTSSPLMREYEEKLRKEAISLWRRFVEWLRRQFRKLF